MANPDEESAATVDKLHPWWRGRWVIVWIVLAALALVCAYQFRDVLLSSGAVHRPECAQIDPERSQGVIFTNPPVAREHPDMYCACLSEAARRTSSNWSAVAILSGLVGAFLTLLGGALGRPEKAPAGTLSGERGILLAGLGALLISAAVYANSRASAASTAAADTHTALTLPEKDMFVACVRAKSIWMSSRVDSSTLLIQRVDASGKHEKSDSGPRPTPTGHGAP